jgi:hypothetical protein
MDNARTMNHGARMPSPHNYHVMDVTCPADYNFVAEFRSLKAAREYALDLSARGGCVLTVVKGEYVR